MRFYDPEFGEVLIDGQNIKNYPIQYLRAKMGLVMQEPTLFNYTVKENILYGNTKASNSDIQKASIAANATEFIESKDLENAFDNNTKSLLSFWTQNDF
jgi:ABC-type multidrug transport system fused ATPase/permease subunit